MKTVEFLAHLRRLDIQVYVENERLRCNAPTGVLTPELRAEIADRKPDILAFLRQMQPPTLPASPTHSAAQPLSFAQQRLWFLEQLAPANPFYNIPLALRLTGVLSVTALEQSFNAIAQRHAALRTQFQVVAGQPMQVIVPDRPIKLSIQPATEADVEPLALAEARLPFDLAIDPLLRVKLLRLSDTEHVLLLTLHHIVADGWSMGVLMRELSAFYRAFVTDHPSLLPPLPIQYADYAQWQRGWLQGDVLAAQLDYWRRQLAELPPLELPSDRRRPPVQTYEGASQTMQLSAHLSGALEALSHQAEVTLFITLLAAFQVLLYRHSGQDDIAVGTPIANRNRQEIEGLIGFFVNSLVMRSNLSGNPTFRQLLEQVRATALDAYAHQDLPFERLVEELQPDRDLSRNPLFQVVFALQNAPSDALTLPGLTLEPLSIDPGTTRFDLEFHVSQARGVNSSQAKLQVMAVYNTDLFQPETIARLLASFQTLLEGIARNAQQPIAALPILGDRDRQCFVDWNQTQTAFDQTRCVHQLFEAQAEQSPQSLAIAAEQQLTYAELNARSNQLAHYLRSQGVTPGALVGICCDRSADLVIAMLAVLKSGGAYLPLDPAYPKQRLAAMVAEAQLSIVLTQAAQQNQLAELQPSQFGSERGAGVEPLAGGAAPTPPLHQPFVTAVGAGLLLICLDRDWHRMAACPTCNLDLPIALTDLAYVIYTSGSTGAPKGVVVEQGGLLNLIQWHQQAFELRQADRATQIAGTAFDACGWEIFPYLAAGASLHFPDADTRLLPPSLQAWLIEQRITVTFLPTPIAEQLLRLDWSSAADLRLMLTGGDRLRQFPAVPFAVVNNYGPTEATVVATSGRVTCDETAPSIGRPIANVQIYLLDAQQQPVPIGAAGDLYIGGSGLARGYLNQPQLTAACFSIAQPLGAGTAPIRLYKTGDRARYRADGSLEFLGRTDAQIKLRGYRIELGEIEQVLMQQEDVQAAAVVQAGEDGGMTAYVAPRSLDAAPQLQAEQVLQWQQLYDDTYRQPAALADPTFNPIGWNSSYTGKPLPAEQMREWVDRRVEQILALQPRRVLEIGCGTGLLLFRLAPHCDRYCGTDFSQAAIDAVQQQADLQGLSQVQLYQQRAIDFGNLSGSFDAVILNSVVQYFPSVEYLLQVIEGAIAQLTPNGVLFLGDIRSLPLLTLFHTAVQVHQAEPSLTQAELQQRIQAQVFQESELAIDPAFFLALRRRFPAIQQVQIHLTAGRHHNEMTQFRYNVVLRMAESSLPQSAAADRPLDWVADRLTLSQLADRLHAQPARLRIAQIPNARLTEAVQAARWLADPNAPPTVGEFRRLAEEPIGVDPEAIEALAADWGYRVQLSWSAAAGAFDAQFSRSELNLPPPLPPDRPWQAYANNPLRAQGAAHWVPQLKQFLQDRLPDYMIPSDFVVLESLPLTPNGKIDRRALAEARRLLEGRRIGGLSQSYAAPQTAIETRLAALWAEVLAVPSVGIHDNFFQLGGHSLLATQLVSRIRDAFAIELPLRRLFEAPTIAELVAEIEQMHSAAGVAVSPQSAPIAPLPRRPTKLSSLTHRPSP